MFTRNEFLAFVGLGAAGQKFPQEDPSKGKVRFNGQCPTSGCGWVANPFTPGSDWDKNAIANYHFSGFRTLRCPKCSVVFCQDAEPKS